MESVQQQPQLANLTNNSNTNNTAPKLTPEQEEEQKLRSKYPNPHKPGGSAFVQKLLHKGNKKYFDSGDYNMARSKMKSLINKQGVQAAQLSQNQEVQQDSEHISEENTEQQQHQQHVDESQENLHQQQQLHDESASNSFQQNTTSDLLNTTNESSHNHTPVINVSSPCTQQQQQHQQHHVINANTSFTQTPPTHSLSSSVSSSSLHHIQMLSSSISAEKLSNIHLNPPPQATNAFLDSEEIGHGIPTPECLPQSRKHSIAQSKLATPRLSTS